MSIVKVAINIPSGKLICGNDFRSQYNSNDEINFDINETVGIKQTIEEYGRRELFHGFCGNSCPGLYLESTKLGHKLSIASAAYDKANKEIDSGLGKEVAGICTDLWWYSVADYDNFIAHGGEDNNCDIINVEPGRYVLSHNLKRTGHNWKELELFATIERSDEPIKPWKMPEEGAVESIMALLPAKYLTKKTTNVKRPENYTQGEWEKTGQNKHTLETILFVKTAYKRPKINDYVTPWKQIGYELWGRLFDGEVNTFIRNVIVDANQLQDYQYMANRAVASFEQVKADDAERNKLYAILKEELDAMSEEERAEHNAKLKTILERSLKELKENAKTV